MDVPSRKILSSKMEHANKSSLNTSTLVDEIKVHEVCFKKSPIDYELSFHHGTGHGIRHINRGRIELLQMVQKSKALQKGHKSSEYYYVPTAHA